MKKILLAEDDASMVAMLKVLLGMEGYQVVNTPVEIHDVLQITRDELPDLVLLDVHLGYQNGLDIIRKLRKQKDIKDTKVIMTSGLNLVEECKEAGADNFIQKPYMPDELLEKIRGSFFKP
jgi:DNA-binding response OmpR family regulator